MDCVVEINLDASLLGNYWILGGPFLRAFMTIYDTTNSKIGFVTGVDLAEPRFKPNETIGGNGTTC